MVYFQFFAFSTDCMINRFGYTFEDEKNYIAIIPASSIIFSPIAALLVGKLGKKPLILSLDIVLGIAVFLYMRSLPVEPGPLVVVCLVLIGLHYAIFVAIIWPAMTLSVNRTSVAAALGLATTLQNFFIASLSYFFGYVNLGRTHSTYNSSFLYLALIGACSLCLSIAVTILDYRTGKILSLPDGHPSIKLLRKEMQTKFNQLSLQRSQRLQNERRAKIQTSNIINVIRKISADTNAAMGLQQA